ncbi:another transcription unit protein-like [Diorhabda carinulata]|uniref:another transcription unit protein-like n=1 Tax=Diorhabda carinulata TaxID=1163345 RepID=UPI0025A1D475|nr:another transcription unit protein-like [Diorhabda carinulata]
MSSDTGSDNESDRSITPSRGPAPTPGHGLDRSASNSPAFNKSREVSQSRSRGSRSRSGTPHSRISASPKSHRSGSGDSQRSGSQTSRRSGSHVSNRSESRTSHKSGSPASHRSGSQVSHRSGSQTSHRSGSRASNRSGSHTSRRSGSPSSHVSRRSGSHVSRRSGSHISRKSHASNRAGSVGSNKSAKSNKSATSNRSRSGSAGSNKSASPASRRSGSAASNKSVGSRKSRSRSVSETSKRSASAASKRSASAESHKSRSDSAASKSSRSASGGSRRSGSESAASRRSSKSRSRSRSKSKNRSRSNSPNLQIDDERSQEKRQRDSSEEPVTTKKRKAAVSDSEDEDRTGGEKEKVDAADIFGDADDISISSEDEKKEDDVRSDREDDIRRSRSDDERRSRSGDEAEQRPTIDDEEDKENEPEPIPETRIDVEVPKITCDLGKDIHFVKLPNFLSVETRPFDPETYEDEIDEEETLDEEGRARLKLKVENTIRWREYVDNEGNIKKESNARVVRWSDGSYSLHLGSEIFDVYKQPLQGDHNHLFIRQGTGLQGQAVFRTKLSFRPHSTESFTHRKMTLSLADRSTKTTGIKIMSQVGVDPDLDKATRLKKEEEKLRQSATKQKAIRKKSDNAARAHTNSFTREEDGSDDEGAISLAAIKSKYKGGSAAVTKGGAIYSSDEDGSDFENSRTKKRGKSGRALKDSDDENEGNGDNNESVSEDE